MSNIKNNDKKTEKKDMLISCAINLFREKGIKNTTVSDIAKVSGVAKGTFYLYFNDKDEIVELIIAREASRLLDEAIKNSNHLENASITDKIIFIANDVIETFVKSGENIDIIHKNLYKGLFSKNEKNNSLFSKAVNEFINSTNTKDKVISEKKLYLIVELVGGVCYNSISHKKPYTIGEIKDILFEAIRSIIEI